jgi:hypothetical protein
MGNSERATVVAENRVEDFADREKGAVNAAFAYRDDLLKVIRGVADEHDCSLAGRAPQLTHRNGGNVGAGQHPRRNTVTRHESGQAEGRNESGRLLRSHARASREFLRPGSPESRDAPEVAGESPRDLKTVLLSMAGLQDERDELLRAERVHSTAGQTVTRGIEGFAGLHEGKACTRRLRSSATSLRQLRDNGAANHHVAIPRLNS